MIDVALTEQDCLQVEIMQQRGRLVMYVHKNGETLLRAYSPVPIEVINDVQGTTMNCSPHLPETPAWPFR